MDFKDIKRFTQSGTYSVNISLKYFQDSLQRYKEEHNLIMNPDFQRGHVWTESQQINYVEFFLRGGNSGKIIYFNHPMWMDFGKNPNGYNEFVVVDGLQRLTALKRFLNNEVRAFGYLFDEFTGKPSYMEHNFVFNVNNLKTKKEVLTWYLEMNSGGTPHTEEELNKVKKMLG